MRLRQIALVAGDIDRVVADCRAVLGIEVGFRDPEIGVFGLRNAVMPIGDTFLEVVSPIRDDTPAGRFLARRRGDGGYMVIVQSDDLGADRARLASLGVRIVFEVAFDDVATIHLHPRDVGGAILSLDVARPPESWRWAGPSWPSAVRTDVSVAIEGVELEADDPAAMAERWGKILGRPVTSTESTTAEITLDRGAVRFAPAQDARGDGIAAIDVRMADRARALAAARARGLTVARDEIALGGVRVRMR